MDIKVLGSGSAGNCYRMSDGITSLLLECGISIKEIQKRLDFRLSDVDGCLISHEHKDHSRSVKDVMKAGITCYMTEGTRSAIGAEGHRVHILKLLEQVDIGTLTVLPFQTEHDAQDPAGFLIQSNETGEKLLYATDTYYCRYIFKGLNYIMVEANYADDILQANVDSGKVPEALKKRLLTSHFSLENVKKFLQANDLSRVKEIYLLHLSGDNSDAARFKREIQELTGKVVFVA